VNKHSSKILARVSELSGDDKSDKIYDDWAQDYDDDLINEFGYLSPQLAADILFTESNDPSIEIIDYGCGTGLVGEALQDKGFKCIDGIDISAGMLSRAKQKQAYRRLMRGDLTVKLTLADDSYDAGVCIGSMGAGHVGAQHTRELLRPIKPDGLFIIVMNGAYYESGGFEHQFRQLEVDGVWRIQQLRELNYMSELVRPGWLLLACKY
jgi:predicted TPR repeat methyltransferase